MTYKQRTALHQLCSGQCANVREIITAYLTANGYDGLWADEDCGCKLGHNFMPCDECGIGDCRPGYIQPDRNVGPEKPKEES